MKVPLFFGGGGELKRQKSLDALGQLMVALRLDNPAIIFLYRLHIFLYEILNPILIKNIHPVEIWDLHKSIKVRFTATALRANV